MPYPYPSYSGYPQTAYLSRQDSMGMQQTQQPPQMPQTQTFMQQGFSCRPVTSREEAVAIPADFMSAGTVMPDLGHGMVYIKRFDSNTGLSSMFEFALVQPQSEKQGQEDPVAAIPDYSDTFRALGEQLNSVSDRIDELALKLDQLKAKQPAAKGGAKE